MGGSNNAPAQSTAAQASQPALRTHNFPAFHPEHLGLLAQQLNAGFGGGVEAQRGLLNQIHSAVDVPILNGAADLEALKAKSSPKKKKPDDDIFKDDKLGRGGPSTSGNPSRGGLY